LALLGGWAVLFLLDTFYYSRLLYGAVDALLELERKSKGFIILSTRIDGRFWRLSRPRRRGEPKAALNLSAILFFYLPVAMMLALLACFAWHHTGVEDQTTSANIRASLVRCSGRMARPYIANALITSADKLASDGRMATRPSQYDFKTPLSCAGFGKLIRHLVIDRARRRIICV